MLSADIHPYVDDMRETSPTESEAWAAASQVAKAAGYYGLQDAARKRRPPSRTPGAWAGTLIKSPTHGVFKLVSQDRWDKVHGHVSQLLHWSQADSQIERQALEWTRGFWCTFC
ncbi:hypothetical protein ACA910_016235 [Epithemia clementina (nom. ined.)]